MPYKLVPVSDRRAYIENKLTKKHYSNHPIPIKKAEAQLRILESLKSKARK